MPSPLYSQSYNRYSYVDNNPLNFVDPTGYAGCTLDDQGNTVCSDDITTTGQREDGGSTGPLGLATALTGGVALGVYAGVKTGFFANVGSAIAGAGKAVANWVADAAVSFAGLFKRSGSGGKKSPSLRAAAVRTGSADSTPLGAVGTVGKVAVQGEQATLRQGQPVCYFCSYEDRATGDSRIAPWFDSTATGADWFHYVSHESLNVFQVASVFVGGSLQASARGIGLGVKNTATAVRSASEAYKGSTRVGHALSKHGGRNPDIWGQGRRQSQDLARSGDEAPPRNY